MRTGMFNLIIIDTTTPEILYIKKLRQVVN